MKLLYYLSYLTLLEMAFESRLNLLKVNNNDVTDNVSIANFEQILLIVLLFLLVTLNVFLASGLNRLPSIKKLRLKE